MRDIGMFWFQRPFFFELFGILWKTGISSSWRVTMKLPTGENKNNDRSIPLACFRFRLKESSLAMLEKYGSQLIKVIKFRDSFVMIGQKGLVRGKAIEMVGFKSPLCTTITSFLPLDQNDNCFSSINPKVIGISHHPHMSVAAPSFLVSKARVARLDMACSRLF